MMPSSTSSSIVVKISSSSMSTHDLDDCKAVSGPQNLEALLNLEIWRLNPCRLEGLPPPPLMSSSSMATRWTSTCRAKIYHRQRACIIELPSVRERARLGRWAGRKGEMRERVFFSFVTSSSLPNLFLSNARESDELHATLLLVKLKVQKYSCY